MEPTASWPTSAGAPERLLAFLAAGGEKLLAAGQSFAGSVENLAERVLVERRAQAHRASLEPLLVRMHALEALRRSPGASSSSPVSVSAANISPGLSRPLATTSSGA